MVYSLQESECLPSLKFCEFASDSYLQAPILHQKQQTSHSGQPAKATYPVAFLPQHLQGLHFSPLLQVLYTSQPRMKTDKDPDETMPHSWDVLEPDWASGYSSGL
ncbi:hypothetical protein HYALB_00012329 [Hymenoscyphus albidus]|uniref:Uncharacterized protein n=1 Tax=Hymenoscyphus albidus TaxID=595503 RepID=A0A9N9LLV8_9HELO|nr:hypothetical protein HYALB_00012329 [Hymenoscyphus albidus]